MMRNLLGKKLGAVFLLASLTIGVSACGGEESGGEESGGEESGGGTATTSDGRSSGTSLPRPAGFAGEVTDVVALNVEKWMEESGAPGVTVAVVGPEELEVVDFAGFADIESGAAVSGDDLWRFGSVTKVMTSAIIYQLAGQGLIDLDARVADYLGEGWLGDYSYNGVAVGDSITVKQLLNYTSGLPEYANSPTYYAEALERLDRETTPAETLDWARREGAVAPPGSEPKVTTVGHVAAGLLIEKVTGRPANEVFEEVLFAPAGVTGQAFLPPQDPTQDVVTGYMSRGLADTLARFWPAEDATVVYEEWRNEAKVEAPMGEVVNLMALPQELLSSAGWTGGGLEARSVAVAKIIRALFGGAILDASLVEAMMSPVEGTEFSQGGLVKEIAGKPAYQQTGLVPGFNSSIVYLPELGIAIAASSNVEAPLVPTQLLTTRIAEDLRALKPL